MTKLDPQYAASKSYPIQRPVNEDQIASMFDRISARYDFLNRLLSLRQDQRWRKVLVQHIPFRPGGSMLDMATGTGDVLVAALEKHPEYKKFYGMDISKNMLDLAGVKLKSSISKNITELSIQSAEKIPLEDQSIDALTISFGLRNVVDKKKALKEFSRILKQDGVLLVLEFFQPHNSLFARLFNFYFRNILPTIGALISDKSAYTYLPQSVGSFYSFSELRAVLYELGLIVEVHRSFLFGSCRIIKARKIANADD